MNKLDLEKLNKRIVKLEDMKTALQDVPPMEWPEEVLSSNKTVRVKNAETEEKCVKLEISLL